MYLSHFGLAEPPFSIAPDPRYLYMTRGHQEALAYLLYGVNGEGGFVLLTGEVGAGKTTVCRCLLEQIPQSCDVAYVFNPRLTVEELLSTICTELGIHCPEDNASVKVFVDRINAHLLEANARGRSTVLVIDEAQNLSAEVLEQMRLLTNLETNRRKLLQIILVGQPELAAMLERPAMQPLAQRIVARYHLGPLAKPELAAYVRHRLQVSGGERELFPNRLAGTLHRLSNGIPRVINVLCDRALLGAYVEGKDRVDRATLAKAAREVFGQTAAPRRDMLGALTALLVLTASAAMAWVAFQREEGAAPPEAAATPAAMVEPPVAQRPPTLERVDWPARVDRSSGSALAYAALFRAWGANYERGDACRQAEAIGLRCKTDRGGLAELRETNRPALLQMRDDQGREFDVALTQLEDRSATLSVGGETYLVALSALANEWTGRYTVLWRPPPGAFTDIAAGARGPAVAWVRQQLARWRGTADTPQADPVLDDNLTREVKQFQLAEGLIPDGVVGPRTLMRLSGVADPEAPRLAPARASR